MSVCFSSCSKQSGPAQNSLFSASSTFLYKLSLDLVGLEGWRNLRLVLRRRETGLWSQGPQAPSPSLSRGSCNKISSVSPATAGLIIFCFNIFFEQNCGSNVLFAAFVMTWDINSATTRWLNNFKTGFKMSRNYDFWRSF